jgi:hypothetical protein
MSVHRQQRTSFIWKIGAATRNPGPATSHGLDHLHSTVRLNTVTVQTDLYFLVCLTLDVKKLTADEIILSFAKPGIFEDSIFSMPPFFLTVSTHCIYPPRALSSRRNQHAIRSGKYNINHFAKTYCRTPLHARIEHRTPVAYNEGTKIQ